MVEAQMDEAAFRRELDAVLPWRTRLAAFTGLAVSVGFVVFDWLSLSGQVLWARSLIRALSIPVFVALGLLAMSSLGRRRPQAVVLLLAGVQALQLGLLSMWLVPSEAIGFFPAMLFFCAYLPLPPRRTAIMAALFVAAFVGVDLASGWWPIGAVLKHTGNLLGASVAGVVAAVMAERTARSEHRARQALGLANARLELARTRKDQFFTDVSHELRTPLTSALLALSAEPPDPAAAIRPLRRLQKLVDEMLQLSRVDAKAVHRSAEITDVAAALLRLVVEFSSGFTGKGLQLQSDIARGPLPVCIGADALERVAVNLIGNALKYTPSGGKVLVRVRDGGGQVVLEVEDDGPGIAAADLSRIFDRFVRVESRTGVPGAGIGLAIAKELTELHGGTIGCASQPGGATVFSASWPRAEAGVPAALPETRERSQEAIAAALDGQLDPPGEPRFSDANAPVVLVIEDHRELAARIASSLGGGVRTVTAHDGLAGVMLAGKERPDLIICDVLLPGIDGHEVVRRLRKDLATEATPILLLSALAEREHVLAGLEAGADDTMAKPFDAEMLRARVEALLRLKRRRDGANQAAQMLTSLCQLLALAQGYRTVALLSAAADGQLAPGAWGGSTAPLAGGWGGADSPWLSSQEPLVLTGRSDAPAAASRGGRVVAAPLHTREARALVALIDGQGEVAPATLESLRAAAAFAAELIDRERSMGALAQLADEKQRLSSAVLSGQDSERRRLALELHDGPGQTLVGALLHLDVGVKQAGNAAQFVRARSLVAQALADLRALTHELHPPSLSQHGLQETLRTLAASLCTEHLHVSAEIGLEVPLQLPPPTALGLFRIAQAALANAIRHAQAGTAVVRLHAASGELVLDVEDDGVGFLPSRTEHGVGVPGMRERAASLGGRISIDSELGRGTLVRASVPLL